MIDDLVRSDALPLAILALIGVETLVLLRWRRVTRALVLSFLGAGAALVSALFFHRREGGTAGFALSMLAALALHLWHVALLARVSSRSVP